MDNKDLVRSYVRHAEERIKHAKEALNDGNYPYVVRQCQEAVELLLKASLRFVGVEPPKWHDVGVVLKRESGKFPKWFQELIDELSYYSRVLRKEREPAMYGDEETGTPPEDIYSRFDAEKALQMACRVHEVVVKLVNS